MTFTHTRVKGRVRVVRGSRGFVGPIALGASDAVCCYSCTS